MWYVRKSELGRHVQVLLNQTEDNLEEARHLMLHERHLAFQRVYPGQPAGIIHVLSADLHQTYNQLVNPPFALLALMDPSHIESLSHRCFLTA